MQLLAVGISGVQQQQRHLSRNAVNPRAAIGLQFWCVSATHTRTHGSPRSPHPHLRPPSSSSRAAHPHTALLTPWLLLLLRDGEDYGRALFERLNEVGMNVESSLGYRTLRALEGDGAVTSRRTKSDRGPQRRSYRLTRNGRRRLDELAANITATYRVHDAFVRAYEHAHGGHEPSGSELPAGDRQPEPSRQPDDAARAQRDVREHPNAPAPPSDDASAAAVGPQLLTACLLLLLERGDSYGYGLRNALDEHHIHTDRGGLYRLLRALERDGLLQSRWMSSAAGPRRRFYRLTPQGRRHLAELAQVITATRDSYDAFRHAYDCAPRNLRPRAARDDHDDHHGGGAT